jgi:hypothetical protein
VAKRGVKIGVNEMSDEMSVDMAGAVMSELRGRVIVVATRYRDAMRRYLGQQAEAVARGALLDDLVAETWAAFQDVMQQEEALFALLDTMEAMEYARRTSGIDPVARAARRFS